jgi:hypothetical protein
MSSASEQLATVAATAAEAASAAADAATEVATAEAVTAAAHAVEAAAGALVLDALTETTNTPTHSDDDKWTTQQTLLETQAALILKLNADADDLQAQLASARTEIQSMRDHQALMALEPETVEVLTVPELTVPDQSIAEERLQADKTSSRQKLGFLL